MFQRFIRKIRDTLTVTFLPKGFPQTVTPDYLPYTLWHFLHSVTGTVTGTLSTQALLHALGMGAGSAIGLAATTNWIIKDGFGLLGGVLFAGAVADRFDSHPRRFRYMAALAIQASTLLELLTPLVPSLFLPMASLSNVGKNVGWLASSASRASMHRGFARGDNLGDITGKSGAQGTLAGLMGTVLGIGCSWALGTDPATLFTVFVPLSTMNIWACYKANLAVTTRTLNVERGELALADACKLLASKYVTGGPLTAVDELKSSVVDAVHSPQYVSKREIFVMPYKSLFAARLDLEPSITPALLQTLDESSLSLLRCGVPKVLSQMAPQCDSACLEHYRILIVRDGKNPGKFKTCLWFVEGSTLDDHLKGFIHACLLRAVMEARAEHNVRGVAPNANEGQVPADAYDSLLLSSMIFDEWYEPLRETMTEKGWRVDLNHFAARDSRLIFE
ncbi:vitamin B6 photo-protection and homoeostasis-domain-containing protein [Zopfochytrium polystomum]|nr:vitamin B6 photo-protection and homoeostasis-domain-containing protein [Zopfochytrium polystomum]